MFGEIEAAERLINTFGPGVVISLMLAGGVLLYLRAWGKRHVSEGMAEENDTHVHRAIAEAVKAALGEVTAQNTVLQTRIFEVNDKLTVQTVESAEAKARYEAESAAAANMQAILLERLDKSELARLQERRELEAKISQLSERQAKLESELERYRAQHERAERENSELKAQLKQMQAERDALQAQMTELKVELVRVKADQRARYETEAVLIESADGVAVKKRDTGKLTPPEPAA